MENDHTTLISVIVCTYNRADTLRLVLGRLGAMKTSRVFSYELLVVDDASQDNTAQEVKKLAQELPVPLRYVVGEGKGVAAARNRGIEAAAGEWLAFFDDDQLADPYWLLELWSLAQRSGIPIVGGRRLLQLPPEELRRLAPFSRRLLGEDDYGDQPLECSRANTPAAGNSMINRRVFAVVGKFDETLVRGGEDIDFFRRTRQAGLPAWYVPSAVSYHLIPAHRLEEHYLLWNSQRGGECFAWRDVQEWGVGRPIILSLARLGQAFLVHLPLLAFARLTSDHAVSVGKRCQIWRAMGYALGVFTLTAPRLLNVSRWLDRLEFRKERSSLADRH